MEHFSGSIALTPYTIDFDLSFIGDNFFDEEFILTGSLVNYPDRTASQTFTVKVYSFSCQNVTEVGDSGNMEYTVGEGEDTFKIQTIESPDDLLRRSY